MTRDKFLNKITKIKKTLCKDTSMERKEILNKIDKLNKALEYAEESLEMGGGRRFDTDGREGGSMNREAERGGWDHEWESVGERECPWEPAESMASGRLGRDPGVLVSGFWPPES